MNFFLFAASSRSDSINKKLIHVAEHILKLAGHTLETRSLQQFNAPLYNMDLQTASGLPKEVQSFIEMMSRADGIVMSVPEFNYSIPGGFKNLIDWVSRANPMPFRGRCIQLLSASPALAGGVRGLWATRIPLEGCGAYVAPDMFSLASAYEAFADDYSLKNKQLQQLLESMLSDFVRMVGKLKN
jgi:NAD(P)H-dependent FMN reductase